MPCRFLQAGLLVCLLSTSARGQDQPAAEVFLPNGSFEETYEETNFWFGLDRDGSLAANRVYLQSLTAEGSIDNVSMPVSVSVGDLNADGLPDIAAADPLGYIRVYFNQGTAQDPKFAYGELTTPFLGMSDTRVPPPIPKGLRVQPFDEINLWLTAWANRRQALRIGLADTSRTGKFDIVAGNYYGDIMVIPNQGSPAVPAFRQPPTIFDAMVPTSKQPDRRWGNLFSPLLHDWNGDGNPDLMVGEGSYSANNIHLFLNQGNAERPVFDESKRTIIALGEGREQLTPAVVDFDGDGKPDIIVADRFARLAVHLQPDNWKVGDPFPFAGFVARSGGLTPDAGAALELGDGDGKGITTVSTGDLTGDGLFDLVVGRSDGRIAWARNQGDKQNPKFDLPAVIKADPRQPATWKLPSRWGLDVGVARGNFYGMASCVSAEEDAAAEPRDGSRVLKLGYASSPNQIMAAPRQVFPAEQSFNLMNDEENWDPLFRRSATDRARGGASNMFMLRVPSGTLKLKPGQTYTVSFDMKGRGVSNGRLIFGWRANKVTGEDKVVRGERGAVERFKQQIGDSTVESAAVAPGGNWSTFTKDFRLDFRKHRELSKEPLTSEVVFELTFELAPPDGAVYIDSVKITPKS
jgi:hypothetical protein